MNNNNDRFGNDIYTSYGPIIGSAYANTKNYYDNIPEFSLDETSIVSSDTIQNSICNNLINDFNPHINQNISNESNILFDSLDMF